MESSTSFQNQVKGLKLQEKLGQQNFHYDMKKVFESVAGTVKNVSEEVKEAKTETAKGSKKTFTDLNEKDYELVKDKGIIHSQLATPLLILVAPENKSQFKLFKDHI